MSYLFCTLLYRNGRFDPRFVADAMAEMTPTYPGEQMIAIAVTPEVTAIVHEPGRVKLKVGSSRVDLQACKLEYSIVSPK